MEELILAQSDFRYHPTYLIGTFTEPAPNSPGGRPLVHLITREGPEGMYGVLFGEIVRTSWTNYYLRLHQADPTQNPEE